MEELFKKIGSWLFLIGIVIAVIVGIAFAASADLQANYITELTAGLAVLGFVVGILSFLAMGNITQEKVPTFLIAALILLGISASGTLFGELRIVGEYFANIATTLAVFVAPAAGILAIRAIWDAGKTEEIEKVIPHIPKK